MIRPLSLQEYLLLHSNQEEADTRMVLHAMIASRNCANNIIVNICASKIFFLTGKTGTDTDLKHFIPVHELFHKITGEQQNILMSVYCLTGCDTCNAFFESERSQHIKL